MPNTPEFDSAYKALNVEQRIAVDAIDGPVFVIAGPGTGKTQVLTLRIAQILLKTDTSPENILALTFTESGVAEMKERLTKLIGSRASKVRFHTFHSFAESLVNRYPDYFPRIIGAQVATDAERAEILDAALLTADVEYLRPYGDTLYYHAIAKSAIQTLKRENVTPEILEEKIAASEKEFEKIPNKRHAKGKYEGKLKGEFEGLQKKIAKTRDLLAVYKLYEKGLADIHRYDYDDLILESVRALTEDEGFRREVQEGFFYILADEHQDANRAQNAILELLVEYSDRPNLFIVGDEKQAIYRFQGADLDNVQYFRGRFEGTRVIVLKENYRSTQNILDNALALITASPDERLSRLPLSSQRKEQTPPITIASFSTPNEEVAYIAERIEKLHKKREPDNGVSYENIAILVRRNRDVLWFGEQLSRRNIPVSVGGEDALNNRFVRSLVRFLELINEPRDERLAGVLSLPGFDISAADSWRIIQKARSEKIPVLEVLASEGLLAEIKVVDKKAVRTLFAVITHLAKQASIERPAVVAELALGASGLLGEVLNATDRVESLAAVRAFLTLLEELSEREHDALLPRALELATLYEERNLSLPSASHEVSGYVKLMTVHKAKGREFNYVFMPHLSEQVWSTRAHVEHFHVPDVLSGANELEDERRLLYVGLTRAKEHATLSYASTRNDGRLVEPMPLLEDLDPKLVEKVVYINQEVDPLLLPKKVDHMNSKLNKIEKKNDSLERSKENLPTKDDLATLREAFNTQGLSPTALNNYLQCPWKYFYVSLLRLPEVENKYMLYGTAIHEALKAYADRRARGEEMGAAYLITTFSRKLSRSPLATKDIKELEIKGEKALNIWWKERSFTWPEKVEAELAIEVMLLIGKEELKLRGNLDRVDTLPGGLVRVIDYKTGKIRSRNELMGKTVSSDGNYYRQLQFYKLLLARAARPRIMHDAVIEFVEPDDSGHIRSETFDISDGEVKELELLIAKSVSEILSLAFWNTPCGEKNCIWCEYRFGLAKLV